MLRRGEGMGVRLAIYTLWQNIVQYTNCKLLLLLNAQAQGALKVFLEQLFRTEPIELGRGMCRIECILLHYKANILGGCRTATNQRPLSNHSFLVPSSPAFVSCAALQKAGQSFPTAFCTGNLISVQSTINYKHSLLSTWTFA